MVAILYPGVRKIALGREAQKDSGETEFKPRVSHSFELSFICDNKFLSYLNPVKSGNFVTCN